MFRPVLCAAVGAAVALGCAVARAGQEPVGDKDAWDGLERFTELARGAAGDGQVMPVGTLDYAAIDNRDAIIVVHPTLELDIESLSRFMRDGGRVVLLDDYGSGEALLTHFAIVRAPPPRAPTYALRRNPAFAIAEAATDPPHGTLPAGARVVTNHATSLVHSELTPVLSVPEANGGRTVIALAGSVGNGRMLAVGDASILINSMLRYPGNAGFAQGIVRYGVEDDTWGKRGGRVFIVTGAFRQTGQYGQPADAGALARAYQTIVDAARSLAREGAPPLATLGLAALVALGVLVWVGLRASKRHTESRARYTLPVPLALQGGDAGRAALLGAPGTSRVLALLELKRSLDEQLAWLCESEKTTSSEQLLIAVADKDLLSAKSRVELRALLLRLGRAETVVLANQLRLDAKVTDAEVVFIARAVDKVLSEAQTRASARLR